MDVYEKLNRLIKRSYSKEEYGGIKKVLVQT